MNNFFSEKIIYLVLLFVFPSEVFSGDFKKTLILHQKQEELIDNGAVSQIYIFNLDGNKAFLKIKSWHSLYSCDGSYIVTNVNGAITLSWDALVNKKKYFCSSPSPQFKIKNERNGFYLNGHVLIDENEWYLMTEK